jgi:hypothetical protein
MKHIRRAADCEKGAPAPEREPGFWDFWDQGLMKQMNADSTIPARTTHAEKLEKNRELHPSIDQSIDHVSFPMTNRLAIGQRRWTKRLDRRRMRTRTSSWRRSL